MDVDDRRFVRSTFKLPLSGLLDLDNDRASVATAEMSVPAAENVVDSNDDAGEADDNVANDGRRFAFFSGTAVGLAYNRGGGRCVASWCVTHFSFSSL